MMSEKVKDKDAAKARTADDSNLDSGLEETFPGSDPVSATQPDKAADDEVEAAKPS